MISPAAGEELRIGTSADWREWQRPGNAIEISRGKAGPRFVRRNIDAVANAGDFGGGIRATGSNSGDAGNLIDGSLSSFWAPDWDDDPENMYVELDLGRVVSARRVVLRLREDGPPLELFQVLLSNGERFFDSTGLPLPSIVRYSDRVRYSFNQQRELVIEYGLKPLQFIRIEVDLPTVGAGIYPIQAHPGQRTEFTYYLGWDIGAGSTGFDQLLMRSGADIELGEIRSAGQVLDAEIIPVDGGLDIAFADPFVRTGLIEFDFASTIYRQQMPFEAFLASGREERQIRQRVDVGDVSDAVASDAIAVSLPVGPALIDGLSVAAALVTPNGDGIGDLLRIEFALLNVLQPRLLHVALYDLSGREVRVLHDQQQTAGPITLSWDGLDEFGQLAAPGNYILRVVVQGDAQTQKTAKIIALAY